MQEQADIAVVGAGAAGLMAAIWAGRTARDMSAAPRIVLVDGARKPGAKILVSGGGRCNVTHDIVDENAYSGSTRPAIRNVLRRFSVDRTVAFFRDLGVTLKREETGKLFPTTDQARTVLDAMLAACRAAGAELLHPARIERIENSPAGKFTLESEAGSITARRVILATGGMSLPKTGSDGGGYALARAMGHSITPRVLPALVPLVVQKSCFIRTLSGLTLPATLELRSGTGKRLISFTDSTLCTHFGLSGPGVLDISRHYLHARLDDAAASIFINWLPKETAQSVDAAIVAFAARGGNAGIGRFFVEKLPQRLAQALCDSAGVDAAAPMASLSKEKRRALVAAVTGMRVPVTGDRGFAVAEVTAGGVPLREVRLESMESRVCPGLHLCGEICDVDGRIGGYNFQWAWASGFVAGSSAAEMNVREAPGEL